MRRPGTPRGMTLVEMLVTLGIVAAAIAAAMGVFLSQQGIIQRQEALRIMQSTGRLVLGNLERSVRKAGFGVHPAMAFDFTTTCTGNVACPRDSTTDADHLWFYTRDPQVPLGGAVQGRAWVYQGFTGSAMTLAARPGDRFLMGQVLMVVCDGATAAAYVTVGQTSPGTGPAASAGSLGISLETTLADGVHQHALLASTGCFAAGAGTSTIVFAVRRYHYFVQSYTAGGVTTPWLMLDTGLDENLDTKIDAMDWLPVAENVEDLQIQYVMNSVGVPSTITASVDLNAPRDWVYGNDAGGPVETPDVNATAPTYQNAMFHVNRYSAHPANIRAVRMDLTLRSPDLAARSAGNEVPLVTGNRAATSLPTGTSLPMCRRFQIGSVAGTPNLASRAMFRF